MIIMFLDSLLLALLVPLWIGVNEDAMNIETPKKQTINEFLILTDFKADQALRKIIKEIRVAATSAWPNI